MDMWRLYRDVIYSINPNVIIVIDKFHVVRMANVAMETFRKEVRALLSQESFKVDYWLNKYELLSHAYILKEDFYKMYDAYEKNKAYDKYGNWELQIIEDMQQSFQPLLTAIGNWHKEILIIQSLMLIQSLLMVL